MICRLVFHVDGYKIFLRKDMRFNGAIFSDDLTMEAAGMVGDILTRSEFALVAGCDMILICNNKKG